METPRRRTAALMLAAAAIIPSGAGVPRSDGAGCAIAGPRGGVEFRREVYSQSSWGGILTPTNQAWV